MKKKKFAILTAVFSMAVCLAGCSDSGTIRDSGSNNVEKEKINIEDISWNVDEGIVDGECYVLLNYTNNTQYPITHFALTFKEKSNVTEEEKTTFYSEIQQNFELSDEDIEDVKNQPISMHAETDRVVNPSESVSNIYCFYYDGVYYLKDMNHYNLVEPDIATVKYIEEDKIYTVYYDYSSKKYSAESESEIAYQWSQTDLGNKIPKPDVKVLENRIDDEDTFMFDAYGLSLEQFNAYVEECKGLGFTIEPDSYEGFYSADNTEGYNVYLNYDEEEYSINGTISAPETAGE